MHGILNLDKPPGLSSARAVSRVKRLLPRGTKVGHAGTLDPFATGVLLVLVGRATKQCETLMGQPKGYETVVKLGATTETLDPESPEVVTAGAAPVTREQVDAVLPQFVGTIQQRPPVFSAMKVGGRRAYDLARRGQAVELEPRPVVVYAMEATAYDWPLLTLRIDCGRGTYVRSIARDVGEALGVGGYLVQLRRTRVGAFDAGSAVQLDALTPETLVSHLAPVG
jgi:tRNA pseudouridine55 synthase